MIYIYRFIAWLKSFFVNPKPLLPIVKKSSDYTSDEKSRFQTFLDEYESELMKWMADHPGGEPPPIVEINGQFRWLTRDERRKAARRMRVR